jgi:predicted nucleic acid-binding protein
MIVADSDVLIDFLEKRRPGTSPVADALSRNELATTVISRYEVLAGARLPKNLATALGFLGSLRVYPLDSASADRAAQIFRDLESSGQRIEPGDCMIAGIVLQQGGRLLTRNRKHFERIKGLVLA